jgi:hypothetical protein
MSTSVKNCTEQCGADQSYSLTELVDNCCKSGKIEKCCEGDCRNELKKSTILRAADSPDKRREKPIDFSDICKNSSNPLDSCACQFCNKDGVTNFEECVAKKATEIAECLDKKHGGNGKADLCKTLLEQVNMPTGCRACYACSYKKICSIEKFQQDYDDDDIPSSTHHYIEEERNDFKMAIVMILLAVAAFVLVKYYCKK